MVKNILVVRNDRFGEFLLNIPAMRALKETYPQAKIIAVVSPLVKELATHVGYIDKIIEWRQGMHSLLEKIKFISLLKKTKIDIAIMLNPSRELNIFTSLSGIPVRVGYNRKWGFLLTHKMEDRKYLGQMHEIEYNLELVSLIGVRTKDMSLSLSVGEREADDFLTKINIKDCGNLIVLHPWTSDPAKEWPLENFRDLARMLIRKQGYRVVIIGGKEELTKSAGVFGNINGSLINLTGRTTLTELAALLKKCRFLISADSGPVHLACAVGTRVLAIFRNDLPAKSPRRWGPWGEGHIVIEKGNLSDITVSEVLERVRRALEK